MVLGLFESAEQRLNDDRDLKAMHRRYGDEIFAILESRVEDETLAKRDRKHWARLLRKARSRFAN